MCIIERSFKIYSANCTLIDKNGSKHHKVLFFSSMFCIQSLNYWDVRIGFLFVTFQSKIIFLRSTNWPLKAIELH